MWLNKNHWFLISMLMFLSFVTFSCQPSELTTDKYVSWVMDSKHGLVQQNVAGDFQFEALYQPTAFKAIQDLGSNASLAAFEKQMEALTNYHYLIFRIQGKGNVIKTGLSDPGEMEKRLSYFKHALQQDLFLVQGKDTMPCVLFHFEGTYDLSPQATFSLAFKRPQLGENPKDLELYYFDQILGVDPLALTFTQKSISNLPKLKI